MFVGWVRLETLRCCSESILMKISHIIIYTMRIYRSDKNKITLKAIEKYRYGLRKTVSKHLKNKNKQKYDDYV